MNLKTLGRKATAKMGRQILTVKTHSPALMVGAGAVGMTATVILACRATLKMSEILAEGEENLKRADAAEGTKFHEDDIKKAKFGVKLQTAVNIAKLYAPAVLVGGATLTLFMGSHVILKKRNAGLAAAYAVVDKGFKEYRGRVIADQGAEKDYEYMHGVEEREVVVEGKNGPETKTVKGLDEEAIQNADPETTYKRVFRGPDKDGKGGNKLWSDIPNQNQFTLQARQSEANDLLTLQGYVFLNQVYDLLGFEPTQAGQQVGWVKNPKDGEGDGYISFGVWENGVYRATQWLNGESDSILLDFNVDGPILGALKKV